MRSRKHKRTHEKHPGAGPEMRAEHRSALEAELLARHRTLYPRREAWKMILDPRLRTGRIVMAMLLMLLLGIGACSIPSSYEEEVGQALKISMSDEVDSNEFRMQELLSAVETLPNVQNISVNECVTGQATQVDIMLWGENIDAEATRVLIVEQFPALADAEISTEPLTGTVDCNLGDRVMHDLFEIQVEGSDPESIRQQILLQLVAQGHPDADVVVEVNEEDGQATINLEITEEQEGN